MKPWCWHRFKWVEPFDVPWTRIQMLGGKEVQRYTFQKTLQRGTCEKCGLVRERVVSEGRKAW